MEVTSTKTLNGDVLKTVVPITFQANQAESTIVINDNLNKVFNGEMVQEPQNITQTEVKIQYPLYGMKSKKTVG